MRKSRRLFLILIIAVLLLNGCSGAVDKVKSVAIKPEVPEKLKQSENGVPELRVYDVSDEKLERMNESVALFL